MLSATAIYPTSKDCSRMIGGSICVLKPLAVEEMLKQERRRIPITAPIPTTVKAMVGCLHIIIDIDLACDLCP